MHLLRLLTLDDFLTATSTALGIPESELDTEHVLVSAKRTLDRAGAPLHPKRRGETTHDRLSRRATEMVRGLLRDPPLAGYAGHVAFAALKRLLAHNGARWLAEEALTVLRFDQESRRAGASAARTVRTATLEPFISANLRVVPAANKHPRTGQEPLFRLPRRPPPLQVGVMLSNPLQSLTENERAELQEIRPAIARGLTAAEGRLDGAMRLQLHDPGTSLPEDHASVTPSERWEWVSQLLREDVDALIVCDVGAKPADFDNACDLDQHTLQDGPVLYLRSKGCERCGRYLDGRTRELGMRLVPYQDLDQLSQDVANWIVKHAERIEAAVRRRCDRKRMYRSLKRRLKSAWDASDALERRLAADAAGMTVEEIQRMLTSSLTVALAPAHRLDTLCRTLVVSRDERRVAGDHRHQTAGLINFGALLQAGAEQGWTADTLFALHCRASTTHRQLAAHRSRLRLTSPEDWIRFHATSGL